MASGDIDKVESFRLELIIHSLTLVSSAKKYYIKACLEKGNEVETGKMKKSDSGDVIFFESTLELNYRSTSDNKPKLKLWVVEFRNDQAFVNGKASVPFHEYYESHPHEKELRLKKCSDNSAKIYLSLKFRQYKVVTSSFIAKVEGQISSSSSSDSSSSEDESYKKHKKVEKIIEKTEEKLEKIVEKADEKIEKTWEKTEKEIGKEFEKAAEKEEKIREKMEKEIEKIVEKGEHVAQKIEKVMEKASEKIEDIEEKLEKKIEKKEVKAEEKVGKIEKEAEKKIEKVEDKGVKEGRKMSSSSSSSSDGESKKQPATPPTHKAATTPNSKSGSMGVADPKGDNKCSCTLL